MIKVYYVESSTVKKDITNMTTDITWSGDINTYPRSLELNVQNAKDLSKNKLINFKMGKMIIFYKDSEELFRGYIFKTNIASNGKESISCYDELVYLTKNMVTMLIKNKSASDVIISQLKKFGLPIDYIEPTKYKIAKLIPQAQSLSDLFNDMLDQTKSATGISYTMSSKKGKISLRSRANAAMATISVDDVISASREISIEELRTQVMVTKGSLEKSEGSTKFSSVTVKDDSAINSYGIMQHVESADDKDSQDKMKRIAQSLLKQLKNPTETLSIEFIGEVNCITGNKIKIYNPITGIEGTYYITADTHTFSNGSHKMSLQISTKIS